MQQEVLAFIANSALSPNGYRAYNTYAGINHTESWHTGYGICRLKTVPAECFAQASSLHRGCTFVGAYTLQQDTQP